MVLCLGEPPKRFLLLFFIFVLYFVFVLHLFLSFILLLLFFISFPDCFPMPLHSTLASQGREGLHQLWALPQLLLIAFAFSSTASATVLSERFLPTGVFHFTLLHRHFWLNLRLSRPPWEPAVLSWSLQGFILILETQTQPICLFDSQ